MNIVNLPRNETPEMLAENFLELVRDGKVKCVVMAIMAPDGSLRFEWSSLPNNLAAIGMAELLKLKLAEQ